MKFYLSQAPFVRLAIPFIVGIILSINFPLSTNYLLIILFSSIFASVFFNFLLNKREKLKDFLFNIFVVIIFCSLGSITTNLKQEKMQLFNGNGIFLLKTNNISEIRNNSIRVTANLLAKKDSMGLNPLQNEEVILFLNADSTSFLPRYGDFLIINSEIHEIEAPKNPEQFNYKRYLYFNSIKNGSYVKNKKWQIIRNEEFNIYKSTNNIRNYLVSKLNDFNFKDKNKGIIAGISLGDRNDIDDLTNKQYTNAGVMHILSVSGMHVGIVFLILIALFKPMLKYKNGKIITYFSIILILWFYAIITGLTPSVLRSVLMFSLFAVGDALNKKHNIYNTIFASALILLLINPFYLMQVGFQLSYLAVIGIIFFQPRFNKIVKSKNKIVNYFWSIVSVSLAAQLATTPITLLYFHQFPVYFLLANIAIAFSSTLVLIIGLLFFIVHSIPYLNFFVAKILDFSTSVLNITIEKINNLPHPIIDKIYWDFPLTIVSSIIIILFAFYLINRKLILFNSILIFFSLLFIYSGFVFYKNTKLQEICFFSINNHTILGFNSNKKTHLLGDKNYPKLNKDIKFNISSYTVSKNAEITKTGLIKYTKIDKTTNVFRKHNFLKFLNKTIYVYNGEKIYPVSTKITVDYLVIQKYNAKNIINLFNAFSVKKILISPKILDKDIENVKLFLSQNKIYDFKLLSNSAEIIKL